MELIFDGRCGMCTASAMVVRRLDRRSRIRLQPYQDPEVLDRFDLSLQEAERSVWAISPAGRFSGAAAINAVLDTALGIGIFSALYRFPGIGWFQEWLYRWVASHRRWFPGTTPWCDRYPQRCTRAAD